VSGRNKQRERGQQKTGNGKTTLVGNKSVSEMFLPCSLASQEAQEKALASAVPGEENCRLVNRYNVGVQGNLQQFAGLNRRSIGNPKVPFIGRGLPESITLSNVELNRERSALKLRKNGGCVRLPAIPGQVDGSKNYCSSLLPSM
jgi:hypothetical protein